MPRLISKEKYNQGRRQRGASGARPRPPVWNRCPPILCLAHLLLYTYNTVFLKCSPPSGFWSPLLLHPTTPAIGQSVRSTTSATLIICSLWPNRLVRWHHQQLPSSRIDQFKVWDLSEAVRTQPDRSASTEKHVVLVFETFSLNTLYFEMQQSAKLSP